MGNANTLQQAFEFGFDYQGRSREDGSHRDMIIDHINGI